MLTAERSAEVSTVSAERGSSAIHRAIFAVVISSQLLISHAFTKNIKAEEKNDIPVPIGFSVLKDPRFPHQSPLYSVGTKVVWSDGSFGKVIGEPSWHVPIWEPDDDDQSKPGSLNEMEDKGEWYYPILFREDGLGLTFPLPQSGLKLRDVDETAPLKSE